MGASPSGGFVRSGRGATWRLAVAAVLAFIAMPAYAHAQHSKLSLESIGPAGGNGAFPADLVGSRDATTRVLI